MPWNPSVSYVRYISDFFIFSTKNLVRVERLPIGIAVQLAANTGNEDAFYAFAFTPFARYVYQPMDASIPYDFLSFS